MFPRENTYASGAGATGSSMSFLLHNSGARHKGVDVRLDWRQYIIRVITNSMSSIYRVFHKQQQYFVAQHDFVYFICLNW